MMVMVEGGMRVFVVGMEGGRRMFVVGMEGGRRMFVDVMEGRWRMFVIRTRMVRWFVMVLVVLFPGIK